MNEGKSALARSLSTNNQENELASCKEEEVLRTYQPNTIRLRVFLEIAPQITLLLEWGNQIEPLFLPINPVKAQNVRMADLKAYFQLVDKKLMRCYCLLYASDICAACLHESIVSFAEPQSLQRNLALRTVIVLKHSSMNIAVSTSSYIVATSFRYAVTQIKMCSARTSEAKVLAKDCLNRVDLFFVDDMRVYVAVTRKPVSYSIIRRGSRYVYWRPHA